MSQGGPGIEEGDRDSVVREPISLPQYTQDALYALMERILFNKTVAESEVEPVLVALSAEATRRQFALHFKALFKQLNTFVLGLASFDHLCRLTNAMLSFMDTYAPDNSQQPPDA